MLGIIYLDLVKSKERKTYRVERVYRRRKGSENSIESKVARLIELNPSGDVVIADKPGEVNEAVVELIGLQFEDFTRSVVLPQNKFQEFLLSQKSDKTKMLERIFYLEEYGRELTEKVNRRLGRIRTMLSGVERALAVLGDISEASLKDAETNLKIAEEYKKSTAEALKASEAEHDNAKEIWELSAELREARQTGRTACQEGCCRFNEDQLQRAAAAQSLMDRIIERKKTEEELKSTEEELEKLDSVFTN